MQETLQEGPPHGEADQRMSTDTTADKDAEKIDAILPDIIPKLQKATSGTLCSIHEDIEIVDEIEAETRLDLGADDELQHIACYEVETSGETDALNHIATTTIKSDAEDPTWMRNLRAKSREDGYHFGSMAYAIHVAEKERLCHLSHDTAPQHRPRSRDAQLVSGERCLVIQLVDPTKGKVYRALIDTGASKSYVSQDRHPERNWATNPDVRTINVVYANNARAESRGAFDTIDLQERKTKFSVTKDIVFHAVKLPERLDFVLGMDWLEKYDPQIVFSARSVFLREEPRRPGETVVARDTQTLHAASVIDAAEESPHVKLLAREQFAKIIRAEPETVFCVWVTDDSTPKIKEHERLPHSPEKEYGSHPNQIPGFASFYHLKVEKQ